MDNSGLIIIIATFFALVVVVVDIISLLRLMKMRDQDFPGRYDKPTWVALILFLNLIGAIMFLALYPRQDVASSSRGRGRARDDDDRDEEWCCPECRRENPNDVYQCENCGYTL